MSADASSYLPLCVHLQNVHHIDHDVLVRLLVLPHPEGHSEPAGSTRAHVGFTALLLPLAHLKWVRGKRQNGSEGQQMLFTQQCLCAGGNTLLHINVAR